MEKIILPTASHYHVVSLNDIVFCKSSNSTTTFYLSNNQEITVSISIKEFEKRLAENGFFRTHQSYLVNMRHIQKMNKANACQLTLTKGFEVPVSTRKRKELLLLLVENI